MGQYNAKPGTEEKSVAILEKHASLPPLGIQHVVECPALLPTIERWSASEGDEKEKAE